MLKKEEIDLTLVQTNQDRELEDFKNWMIGIKGMSAEQGYNYSKYLGKQLRDNHVHTLTTPEIWRLVTAIRCSKYSKCHQIHLLDVLELYLEFKGIKNEQGCFFKFEKPRPNKKAIKYLTHEQMITFIHGARDYRDFALVMIFLTTGVRLAEMRALNVGDVDLENGNIRVLHGKGDKGREIPLSEQCISAIKTYYTHYNLNAAKPTEPLFKSVRGDRWSEHAIQAAIIRIGENAGLKARVTPHMLRHSFASHCVQNGCDIYSLKEILGHSDIAVTQVYLHCNSSQLRLAYEKGVPRF